MAFPRTINHSLLSKDSGIPCEKSEKINQKSKQVKIISGIRKCGKSTLLRQIYYDIIYRDIAVRHKLRHVETLKKIVLLLITNASKKISCIGIKNTFSIGSTNTVIDYISYFADSCFFYVLPRFDYSVKKQIANARKIYSVDTGLSSVNSTSFSEDSGRKLENIVFIHLRNHYRDIYYYTNNYECDFVVRKKQMSFRLFRSAWS